MANAGNLRAFLVAVQFLTRVPVPGGNEPATPELLQRAVVFFPLVGALIGAMTAAVMTLGALVWPPWLAALVALALEAWITGAFHEDAVGDFFDAFGGGWTREQVLTILKDSRIGSFGTVAIALGLLLRGSAMAAIPESTRIVAIIAAGAMARLAIIAAMALVPPVENRASLARDVGSRVKSRTVFTGAAFAAPALVLLAWIMPVRALMAAAATALVMAILLRSVMRTLGGITGDCLGCLAYLVQVAVLLCAAAQPGIWA